MDIIAVASFVTSAFTAISTITIAFIALQQTARPNIDIAIKGKTDFPSQSEAVFTFEIANTGHWYASPPAINIAVYCNFEPSFTLRECRYGSMQEKINTNVRIGKKGLVFVRAKEIKLIYKGDSEVFQVIGTTPTEYGRYRIAAAAFSENGASCRKDLWVRIAPHSNDLPSRPECSDTQTVLELVSSGGSLSDPPGATEPKSSPPATPLQTRSAPDSARA